MNNQELQNKIDELEEELRKADELTNQYFEALEAIRYELDKGLN